MLRDRDIQHTLSVQILHGPVVQCAFLSGMGQNLCGMKAFRSIIG